MTRNIVIGAINLAIAAIIGINAIVALTGGCSIGGGRCDGSSTILTWALAVVMPAIVIIGGFFLLRAWRSAAPSEKREISFSLPAIASARPAPDESDSEADDAMSARLARTTFAAHVADVADEAAENSGADESNDQECSTLEGRGEEDVEASTVVAPTTYPVDPGAGSAFHGPDDGAFEQSDEAGLAHEPAPVDPQWDYSASVNAPSPAATGVQPLGQWSFESGEAAPDEDARAIDWLVDSDDAGFSPLLREDSGFPWVVAGIDHVCSGVARIGHRLVGTDFPAEAAAWRQVVGGLARHEALGTDDCRAFVDWVNGILDVSGDAGLDLIEDALHELGVEAATDPLVSARLPADMADFGSQRVGDQVLRRAK